VIWTARVACEFLAWPEMLTPEGRAELRALLERAWGEAEITSAFRDRDGVVLLEVKLEGGLVRAGAARAGE
jgi:hypothetical protein